MRVPLNRYSFPERARPAGRSRARVVVCCAVAMAVLAMPAKAATGDDQDAAEKRFHEVKLLEDIAYVKRGEKTLKADIYVPSGEGPFVGVLMVHGGAWVSGGKWQMGHHARAVARHGYTVVSISYRLAPAAKFPAQLEDCAQAVSWIRQNAAQYKIDPDRIAGYGYSAGGHLVCLLGLALPREVFPDRPREGGNKRPLQAVVAGGTPCDFRQLPERSRALQFLFGGSRGEMPEMYRRASPAAFATAGDPPTFFFHGEVDRLVPRADATSLQQTLSAAGVRAEMHVVADKGHVGAFFDKTAPQEAVRFLDQVFKQTTRDAPEK